MTVRRWCAAALRGALPWGVHHDLQSSNERLADAHKTVGIVVLALASAQVRVHACWLQQVWMRWALGAALPPGRWAPVLMGLRAEQRAVWAVQWPG